MEKRYAHYWFPQRGSVYPNQIAVVDCDAALSYYGIGDRIRSERLTRWNCSVSQLRHGRVVSMSKHAGEDASRFLALLSQLLLRKCQTWLFMLPALRVMSLLQMWDMMERSSVEFAVIEEPPTVLSMKTNGISGKLLILDLRNYGIEPLNPETTADERCQRYLDTVHDIVSTLRQGGFGSLRCTAGSQAVSALRTKYDCVRLHCHTNKTALGLERGALYGGRCEAYRIGVHQGAFYHLDVRNLYPALCLDLPIPVSLRRVHHGSEDAERACRARPGDCVAAVTVRTTEPIYPYRTRGIVLYPVGEYSATLCGPELANAVAKNHITRWHSAAEYTCAPLLSSFYKDWLSLLSGQRARGATQVCEWIKRVMTALIGKFAEPGRSWEGVPSRGFPAPYGVWTEDDEHGQSQRYRSIAWHTERQHVQPESYWSIPAITAWVMSAGRQRLWNYIACAGRGNVWYCDTDSVITNRDGFDKLLHAGHIRDGEAGYLRLLGTHSKCVIHGIRHYELDEAICCAGVPLGAIACGESRVAYWERQSIKREIALGRRPAGDERLLSKCLTEDYLHGKVMPDGRVIPWEIDANGTTHGVGNLSSRQGSDK